MKRRLLKPNERTTTYCECGELADWTISGVPAGDGFTKLPASYCNSCASEVDPTTPAECPDFIEPAAYHRKEARKVGPGIRERARKQVACTCVSMQPGTVNPACPQHGSIKSAAQIEIEIAELADIGEAVRDLYPSFKPGQAFRMLPNSIVDDLQQLLTNEQEDIAAARYGDECITCGMDEKDCDGSGTEPHTFESEDDAIKRQRMERCERIFNWLTKNPTTI